MGIDLKAMRDAGGLIIQQMDAAEVSPGEFAHKVRSCVEKEEYSDGRHRQFERLPKFHAPGAVSYLAHA